MHHKQTVKLMVNYFLDNSKLKIQRVKALQLLDVGLTLGLFRVLSDWSIVLINLWFKWYVF